MKSTYALLAILFGTYVVTGQVYADLPKEAAKKEDKKNLLPIFGNKARNLGFDLPYSAGLSVNYLWQESNVIISNVAVGFNNGPIYNVDELLRFNSATSESNGINVRPDIWLFPFLNVYGIFATATSTTGIDVGIWIPRIDDSQELFSIQTRPEFKTTTAGFGLTPTVGFMGGWVAFDMNFTWTDVDAQENPVFAFVFDPRIGKTFQFSKPHRNISIWIGGFRLKINRDTRGELDLSEVLPIEEWNQKVISGQGRVADAQVELTTWWENLSPVEQRNPVNIAKFEVNQRKLNLASNFLNAADNALDTADNSTLQYELDKQPQSLWSLVFGAQFQYNKSLMVRAEYGYARGRDQFLAGLQYRFDL